MTDRSYQTEQEEFWAGEFGSQYIDRNRSDSLLASNLALFAEILSHTRAADSVLELGANIGMNLRAVQQLQPDAELTAVEINADACEELTKIDGVTAHHESILEFEAERQYDLVFTKGVLIHLDPEMLQQVYQKMVDIADRYICVIEYYNPAPVEILYRGHRGRLFKRDFAGELLDGWNLDLLDYGFVYHRAHKFPQDDLTWFLLEKKF
jgi:spore coat polysaccharide biosynthesis protein SpsF